MVRRFLVTVRIRRRCGPQRVRVFVVHISRPAGEWAAPSLRAAAALVLMLLRSQRRGQQPHPTPGHDDGQHPSGGTAAASRSGSQPRGSRHPHPARARRGPGGLPGHADGSASGRCPARRARRLGPPARGPG
ncbi:tumor suppressor ARF isoform X2 [Otolemur garnettii]|uniref:tumor suppressor ARF isoform X2 n=1 Tax=Otolemur garnettii TaxID=30611 RepID=UPI000C7F59CD|nr:tumor suppressor ARF isoform X2 [Otolemur garnettii]